MPNIWLKLSDVLGAWFVSALVLLIAPILFFPFTVIGWLAFGFASPAAVYSFTYDKDHMAVVGVLLMLLLAWKEGFKASLSDAAALAKYEYETDNPGWLERYYLRRNRDLVEAYWRVYNFEVAEDSLEEYLKKYMPEVYRHHTQELSFLPDWPIFQHVSGHVRSGHIRNTRNGPVAVRSHHVSGHTRNRRR
ncbi:MULTISPECIES: hypothetical protein [unclassified Pseudomonas]|uniref:hypothetical protein n=1 Tax=unclassified Pseudomonas TaxID=196821 RepID=UPI0014628B3D|nr:MULTISPECIES: hypothetical protein [unclassified Pseudomonas]QJQ22924.1 hypothetical protein HG549_24315 [Pseudomonas sp. SK]UPK88517.1 hypothetical protein E5221_27700 [Pseudomonas sp. A2]